jgi:glycosyltransferase involved in cell wall biosynthesis
MIAGQQVALIIPALDEEATIGPLLEAVDRILVDQVVVADNGSLDRTGERARQAGATVVRELRRGYGSACLRALREVPEADILVFMDADGSDDPHEIALLLAALRDRDADLVIGSRVLGRAESGSLSGLQRFGNALTCTLVRLFWSVRYSDLGPFRAIRRVALDRLEMSDPDFGWTIEMQVKAAQHGLRAIERHAGRFVPRRKTDLGLCPVRQGRGMEAPAIPSRLTRGRSTPETDLDPPSARSRRSTMRRKIQRTTPPLPVDSHTHTPLE